MPAPGAACRGRAPDSAPLRRLRSRRRAGRFPCPSQPASRRSRPFRTADFPTWRQEIATISSHDRINHEGCGAGERHTGRRNGQAYRVEVMRILAVDDDAIILELLAEIMKSAGYPAPELAHSGAEALAILGAADEPFDCFLLDIQMPEMDGIELCRRIRGLPQYGRAPILMLTAMAEKSYIDRAFAAGASDYITKPFDVIELVTRLRNAQTIVEERRRHLEHQLALMAAHPGHETKDRALLTEPIQIPDIDGMIEHLAFENYLLQLSRGRQFMSSLLAAKIANITEIFETCSPRTFRFLIADIAEAISDSLRGREFLMAYRGAGLFVVACDRRMADAVHADLKANLQLQLDEVLPLGDHGRPIPIDAVIGAPRAQGLFRTKGALAPMHEAIADVERRALELLSRRRAEATAAPSLLAGVPKRRKAALVHW
ncbi:MAG: response regulator [Alphaproteobacteria bacterium]|nr:MAG: response regulator [Alphaproteobacteria bacterium]